MLQFPQIDCPRASIITIAWKQLEPLLACLQSISDACRGLAYEVIVVSNDAPRWITDAVRSCTNGVRVVEAHANLGFGGACNLGASVARGDYVIFLNDDARIAQGWLEWLLATADANAAAGAIGSLILFPEGRIQEAGSIIWADGSTMPIGRGLPGDSTAWHFVRTVDYVSACSLMVSRRAWDRVGGFDPTYYPAYYEDVDLCLALRESGYDVLLEPRSRVWHDESSSSNNRFKNFLFARNQRSLYDKWADTLKLHEPAQPDSPAAAARAVWRARGVPPRILVIDDRVPDSSLGSGFGRMFLTVLALAQSGYALTILPTAVKPVIPDALISAGVSILDDELGAHLSLPWVSYELIIVSRPHNFEKAAPIVRKYQPNAVLLYDCEALFWKRIHTQSLLSVNDDKERGRLERASAEMRTIEDRIAVESDVIVTVSDEEAALLREIDGHCPIRSILPTELGVEFGEAPFWERCGIVYVAGWLAGGGSPNADGLRWFEGQVLPLVRTVIPWVRVAVTGANPPADLLELENPNLAFQGHVGDISGLYDRSRVAISPIRFGAGVKLKTVQALQHGVPVVSTSCGAEGIAFHGLDAIAIADTAHEFSEALVHLLTNHVVWEKRRAAIRVLLEQWQGNSRSNDWPDVVGEALARRSRGSNPLLVSS